MKKGYVLLALNSLLIVLYGALPESGWRFVPLALEGALFGHVLGLADQRNK